MGRELKVLTAANAIGTHDSSRAMIIQTSP